MNDSDSLKFLEYKHLEDNYPYLDINLNYR